MSTEEEHIKIVAQNYQALSHLASPTPANYTEWCTTVIYYMSLHYIHAYLAGKYNDHPSSHSDLQPKINSNSNLKSLYTKYRDLEDDSRKARYDGEKLSIYEMRNSVLKWFIDIQNKICNLLSIPAERKHDLYHLFPLNPN